VQKNDIAKESSKYLFAATPVSDAQVENISNRLQRGCSKIASATTPEHFTMNFGKTDENIQWQLFSLENPIRTSTPFLAPTTWVIMQRASPR
jgi:hypothetical protein